MSWQLCFRQRRSQPVTTTTTQSATTDDLQASGCKRTLQLQTAHERMGPYETNCRKHPRPLRPERELAGSVLCIEEEEGEEEEGEFPHGRFSHISEGFPAGTLDSKAGPEPPHCRTISESARYPVARSNA